MFLVIFGSLLLVFSESGDIPTIICVISITVVIIDDSLDSYGSDCCSDQNKRS